MCWYPHLLYYWGRSKVEHDKNLEQVLACIEKSGLKLNKTKCKFGLNEVKYVGHILSSEGVRADPSKIEVIVDMLMPENASDIHRFLGMVIYFDKFLPNLSDKTACLKKLIEKDAAWDWTEEHTKQFWEFKIWLQVVWFFNIMTQISPLSCQ